MAERGHVCPPQPSKARALFLCRRQERSMLLRTGMSVFRPSVEFASGFFEGKPRGEAQSKKNTSTNRRVGAKCK
jgi:hypothetical protein